MSPLTHLLASWVLAAETTDNSRDARLVALAGLAPDLDGLGLIADVWNSGSAHPTQLYARYHHYFFHGAFGALMTAAIFGLLARRRGRVALLCLVTFHLHLFCDLAGSRGPGPEDLWPIYYLGPFTHKWVWLWHGQWPLDAWINRIFTLALLAWVFVVAIRRGSSVVGVFSAKGDAVFVGVLRRWWLALAGKGRSARI